jgi:hypothetical protein
VLVAPRRWHGGEDGGVGARYSGSIFEDLVPSFERVRAGRGADGFLVVARVSLDELDTHCDRNAGRRVEWVGG